MNEPMLHFDQLSREAQDRILASNQSMEETMDHFPMTSGEYASLAADRNRQRIKALEEELERQATQHPADRVDESLEKGITPDRVDENPTYICRRGEEAAKVHTGIHPRHEFLEDVDWDRIPKVDNPDAYPPKTLSELLSTEKGMRQFAEALVADQLDAHQKELYREETERFLENIKSLKQQKERQDLASCIPDSWPTEDLNEPFKEFDVFPGKDFGLCPESLRSDELYESSLARDSRKWIDDQVCQAVALNTEVGLPFSFEEYQVAAKKTAIYNPDARVLYPALGLAGEVGEVLEKAISLLMMAICAGKLANQVKKVIRDDDCECDTPRKHEIGKEIGGVLWYCAAVASDLGLSLADIAQENLDVLASRQERGVIKGDGDNR